VIGGRGAGVVALVTVVVVADLVAVVARLPTVAASVTSRVRRRPLMPLWVKLILRRAPTDGLWLCRFARLPLVMKLERTI
jgi:hypothetical protein